MRVLAQCKAPFFLPEGRKREERRRVGFPSSLRSFRRASLPPSGRKTYLSNIG